MTPAAKELSNWLRVRAQVLLIEHAALDAAVGKVSETERFRKDAVTAHFSKPRPLLVLPSNSNFARRLRGLVQRKATQ